MEFPEQIGKWLIVTGLFLCGAGLLVILLAKLGLFRLPGDIDLMGKNWRVFVPITSCLILSAALTLLMWIVNYLKK
ncbi:MAG TPA: DUF2905 domain-containing protein [Anaerohalosphaeraceae bacterium]|nr:DUF2905 domain-containing protein [Anaerohalosphaeraceae bacterium]